MVDPTRVRLVQGGPTLAAPAPLGSAIFTAASSVVRSNYWRLRDAAAVAREMLVTAAMNRRGDAVRANYGVVDGLVTHAPSGQRWSYGELAADAALLTPPDRAPLVPDAEFQSIGRSIPRADIPAKVDGSAVYGLDVRLPGMLFATVRMNPHLGGAMRSYDATTASSMRGVHKIVPLDGGVIVIASNTWSSMQAAKAIECEWADAPYPASTAEHFSALEQAFAAHRDSRLLDVGDVDEALQDLGGSENGN